MITVAITGGTGFIGRALADAHLRRGDRVRVLTRRPGAHPKGTVAFEGDLAASAPTAFADGADIVYHLAAELEDRSRMRAVNVLGTARLLDTAMGRCGRWVQLSSVGVYGPTEDDSDITEFTAPKPRDEYERSKLEADLLVKRVCEDRGCSWSILRPSIVVGASMRNAWAHALVRAIASGRFVYVGPKDAKCTCIHVADVAGGLIAIAHAPAGTVANLSSDCAWTDLVERICARAGCAPPRLRVPAWLARTACHAFGGLNNFPLTLTRVHALTRRSGYPAEVALRLPGFRITRPMPAGFDEVIDRALAAR
jgi:nucleoside-diphosphate-sugar epimerase